MLAWIRNTNALSFILLHFLIYCLFYVLLILVYLLSRFHLLNKNADELFCSKRSFFFLKVTFIHNFRNMICSQP